MPFSVNKITLVSDAEALLQIAQRDKRNLQHRKDGIAIRTENTAEQVNTQAAELKDAQDELVKTDTELATATGEKKENLEIRKLELQLKIKKLSKTGNKVSAFDLLETEYNAHLYEQRLRGIDDFITAVSARKAELA
jgi:hypothetical protein